jgi:hypothetical protein
MLSVAIVKFSLPEHSADDPPSSLCRLLEESGYRTRLLELDHSANSCVKTVSDCEGFDLVAVFHGGDDAGVLHELLASLGERGHITAAAGKIAALSPGRVLEMGADFAVTSENPGSFIRLFESLESGEDPLKMPWVLSANSDGMTMNSEAGSKGSAGFSSPSAMGGEIPGESDPSGGNRVLLRGTVRLSDGYKAVSVREFPGYESAPAFLSRYPGMEVEVKMGGQNFVLPGVVDPSLRMGSLLFLPSSMDVPESAESIIFRKPGYRTVMMENVPVRERKLDFKSVVLEPGQEGIEGDS